MFKYRFTQRAVDDLAEIWNYTFDKWSENQADRYYYMLLDNCNDVSLNPSLGKSYSVIMKKKQLNLKYSFYEILQMISLAPFDRTPLKKLFENAEYQDVKEQENIQLKMF